MTARPREAFGEPGASRKSLYLSSLSHLRDTRLRRILQLAGYHPRVGLPGPEDLVAVWGDSATAARGRALARHRGAGLLFLEDSFLRSVLPGRAGGLAHGLLLDRGGPYFDARSETELEALLANAPPDTAADIARARDIIALLQRYDISKYNIATAPPPPDGFVLVVDQVQGDRAIEGAGADARSFRAMLESARADHPNRPIVIQRHPETTLGLRRGYFDTVPEGVTLLASPVPPYRLLHAAHVVYTVSSQLGFEAILAGHRPVLFGQPFYAGWGLSEDRAAPLPRRGRTLSVTQLVMATLVRYPIWYDPYRDCLSEPETVITALAAQARAYTEDAAGSIALGMRLWKRASIARFFGDGPVQFTSSSDHAHRLARKTGRPILAWGARGQPGTDGLPPRIGVEDGFIRSRGLGANLVPALSLVRDPDGLYFDPHRPSRLETLIAESHKLPERELDRAARLRARLAEGEVTKYNLGPGRGAAPVPRGPYLLLVGQVVDDKSILHGCAAPFEKLADLADAARRESPGLRIVYKPHPDVEAGLRTGTSPGQVDDVASAADPLPLIANATEVWTLTSLLGFEALIRGASVTTGGIPFYAGWGLTRDLAHREHGAFQRRAPAVGRVTLDGLVHAALIGYPRYRDPVTGLACPVEVILDRLENGGLPAQGPNLRVLSKLQGLLASLPTRRR